MGSAPTIQALIRSFPNGPRPDRVTSPDTAGRDSRAAARLQRIVLREMTRRSFCTLATAGPGGQPHAVGVMYAALEDALWIHSHASSRKVRDVRGNPRVAVCIPVRRYPVGPPFCIQFEGTAGIFDIAVFREGAPAAAARLARILPAGTLAAPGGCILRITPARRISTYGLGVSLWTLLRDPLHGSRSVELGDAGAF